jgi:hypothetical protein
MHIQLILKAEKPKRKVTAIKKKVKVDKELRVPPRTSERRPAEPKAAASSTPSRQAANSQPPSQIEKDDW